MRPVRLVEREGVEVDVQGLNVDRPMRSIGDTVHAKQRAPANLARPHRIPGLTLGAVSHRVWRTIVYYEDQVMS